MKVLFLTSTFPRFEGDMQANFVGEQAQAWLAERPTDEITILAPHHRGSARLEEVRSARVARFRYLLPESWQRVAYPAIMPNIRRCPLLALQVPFLILGEYLSARRISRTAKPDVTYAHWVMPQGLVAWALKRHFDIPYVLQNHSSDLSVFLRLGTVGRSMARAILRDCAHFFCVNVKQRKFALSLLTLSEREAFAARCTVLPMGITMGARPQRQDDGRFDIATIARLSKKKGLHYLIQAAELLARRGVRPRIAIAGDGEDRAELQSMVQRADITFAGFLVGNEKDQFFSQSRCFVFPSRSYEGDVEGMPVALLEALGNGNPVLASRDTNIELLPEWEDVRNYVTFIPDPSDIPALASALEQLLEIDPRKTHVTKGLIARYRWDLLIREYLKKIDTALLEKAIRA